MALVGSIALAATGCGGAADTKDGGASEGSDDREKITLVAYSTPQVVYDEVIPEFRNDVGRGIGVTTSFGASGDQSRSVEAGLDADIVTFSIEPDITRLVDAGLISPNWNASPNKGVINTSVVAFIVRPGNPKNIRRWEDLLKPDVEVITPNPFTSGAARWNLLAAYAHGGLPYIETLIKDHVEVQPKSGREALQTFTAGKGDVLLSYEYEAITARKKGEKVDFVIPDETIRIDINIATLSDAPPAATTFLNYLLAPAAQRRFADWGYRPVNRAVKAETAGTFPTPAKLTTIDDLGGWEKVTQELFDPQTGAIAKIEDEAGISTAR